MMASFSDTAFPISRSPIPVPPPMNGDGEIDFLRQAALESRRRKAKLAAEAVAQASNLGTVTAATAEQLVTGEPQRVLKRKASDREEGEISDEEPFDPPLSGDPSAHSSTSGGHRTLPMAPVDNMTMRSGSPSRFESTWPSNGMPFFQPMPAYSAPPNSRSADTSAFVSSRSDVHAEVPSRFDPPDSRMTPRHWPAFVQEPLNDRLSTDLPAPVRKAPAPSSPPRKSVTADGSYSLSTNSSFELDRMSHVLAPPFAGPELDPTHASSSSAISMSHASTSDVQPADAASVELDPDEIQVAKGLVEDLLSFGVPPEHFVDIEISRECIETTFPELSLPLPKNIDRAVPLSVVYSKATGGKKQRTPRSKAAATQSSPQRAAQTASGSSMSQPSLLPGPPPGVAEPSSQQLPMSMPHPTLLNPVPQYPVPDWFAPMMSSFDPTPFGTSSAYGLPLHQMQVPTPHFPVGPQNQSSAPNGFFSPGAFNQGVFNNVPHPFMMQLGQPSVPIPSPEPPQPGDVDEIDDEEARRQREELARKAALASRRLRNLVEEQHATTLPIQHQAPKIEDEFHHELDALLAEVDQNAALEAVANRPDTPSDETDEEREVEEAMLGFLDDGEEEFMQEQPEAHPVRPPSPVTLASPESAVTVSPPPPTSQPVSPPKLFSSGYTSQPRSPTIPSVQRSNRRTVATDLDAQPVSRPESAPILSRPFPSYRRSFAHHQQFTPLIIEISDSEDGEEDGDVHRSPRSPKQSAPPPSARPAPPSRTASGTPGVIGLSTEEARKRLQEKELEIKRMQELLARLEKKKKQSLLSSATSSTFIPSATSSVVSTSGLSTPAGPAPTEGASPVALASGLRGDVMSADAPITGIEERDSLTAPSPSERSGVDVEMVEDSQNLEIHTEVEESGLAKTETESGEEETPTEDKLAVIADAGDVEVPSVAGMQVDGLVSELPVTDIAASTVPSTEVALKHDEQSNPEVFTHWKPYSSIFDDFPLLRSHPPPLPQPTDLEHSARMPFVDIWPLRKGLAAAASRIAPDSRLCQFETSGGICRDDSCPDTHVRDWMITDSHLARHLATLFSNLAEHDIKQALVRARLARPSAETDVIAAFALTNLRVQ